MKNSKKIVLMFLCTAIVLSLVACSKNNKKSSKENKDSVDADFVLNDDGTFLVTYEGDFDKDYYEEKELGKMIDDEINEFNTFYAADKNNGILKESFKVSDKKAILKLKFTSYQDYMNYSSNYVSSTRNAVLFIGKYSDAVAAGFTMAGKFLAPDGNETVDVRNMPVDDNTYVLYTNQGFKLEVPGTIKAISYRAKALKNTNVVSTPDKREKYIAFTT